LSRSGIGLDTLIHHVCEEEGAALRRHLYGLSGAHLSFLEALYDFGSRSLRDGDRHFTPRPRSADGSLMGFGETERGSPVHDSANPPVSGRSLSDV
jgi:hypothetical protein